MPALLTGALRTLAVAIVLAVALTGLTPVGPTEAMPIEGIPSYQPQSRCSPRPKPGTLMLAEHLVRKYDGTSSSGISRSCGSSGVSEHKEGRAFDWRLSAAKARDRGYARDFLGRILATDRKGNKKALARRMGVMYVIWKDHIWSASAGYKRRDYLHSACTKVKKCSTTLRHRDHMHISLTRAAARGKTSWYLRRGAQKPKPSPGPRRKPEPADKHRGPKPPDGILDLRREPFTTLNVPANGRTKETRFKLREGVTYSLTAAGLYSYGSPRQVGDAVCTWSQKDGAWVAKPPRRTKRRFGRLALVVNGERPFGDSCRRSHRYRTHITPKKDRTLRVRVAGNHRSSSGRLTLVVGKKRAKVASALPTYPRLVPAPAPAERRKGFGLIAENVTVPASAPGGSYTVGSLQAGATYRLTVRGKVRLGRGVRSNGQCVAVRGTWYRKASIDRRVPDQDHGNLYVNGVPFSGRSSSSGCRGSHVANYTADARGRMRLDLWDPLERGDNGGELRVKVQRVTPIPTPVPSHKGRPRPKREAWKQSRDWFEVSPKASAGTISKMRLRKRERVHVTIRGRFSSHGYAADASCVKTAAGWRAADPDVLGQDPLNVWVDGQPVSWRALGRAEVCSSEYRYASWFTATKNGPIRVSVFDLDHRDNRGRFEVTLLREKD